MVRELGFILRSGVNHDCYWPFNVRSRFGISSCLWFSIRVSKYVEFVRQSWTFYGGCRLHFIKPWCVHEVVGGDAMIELVRRCVTKKLMTWMRVIFGITVPAIYQNKCAQGGRDNL